MDGCIGKAERAGILLIVKRKSETLQLKLLPCNVPASRCEKDLLFDSSINKIFPVLSKLRKRENYNLTAT